MVSAKAVRVRLPDGSSLEVAAGTTVGEVARRIGAGLAKAAVAAKLDGRIVDLMHSLEEDGELRILTGKDPEALGVLRHSAAHVLATAVRRLHPGAGIGFGPAIEEGFYYDFDVSQPFTPEDLEAIEAEMRKVVDADHAFERRVVTKEEARDLFKDDPLKIERLEELGDGEVITVYRDGLFLDLCRGPHLPSTGRVKHFKLLSTAGAYWRGDERRQMLQRIYGTAWFSKQELDEHLHRLEEAKKRDHRVLGRDLDLFSIQDEVGPGLVLWHPKGARIQFALRRWIEDELDRRSYEFVYTPHLAGERLFARSGHLQAYAELMYPALEVQGERDAYRVKPMNCPMHALIYASRQRSYRELPLRLSEIANVYRHERSGTLHGLLRVRMLTMDDAHIFCAPEQIEDEIFDMLDLASLVMRTFGFEYHLDFATRPEKRIGSDAVWDHAEAALEAALKRSGTDYRVDPGGGAFYGPKIDIKFRDAIGREWQGSTIQLDFILPERLGLEYIGPDNRSHRPVMMHRAILGTLERFVGGLIEHFAGALPVWLAPEQVRVIPISEPWEASAREFAGALRAKGIRATLDPRADTLNYRIRDAEVHKVPYMAVIGEREAAAGTVAVRRRGAGTKQEVMGRGAFIERVLREIETRALS
ncbi:MAG: threonine--tRNA ligase [Gemmatimonadetes bacterium]|nr:threonine--tRNA ligase [Gemmatimonadota bacterium]